MRELFSSTLDSYFLRHASSLKRDIFDLDLITLIIEVDGGDFFFYRCILTSSGQGCGCNRSARSRSTTLSLSTSLRSTPELHGFSDHFGHSTLSIILGGIFPRLEPSFDKTLLSFGQILTGNFRESTPEDNSMEFGSFLTGATLVGPKIVGGHREGRYLLTTGRRSHVRITSESPYQNNFVDVHTR